MNKEKDSPEGTINETLGAIKTPLDADFSQDSTVPEATEIGSASAQQVQPMVAAALSEVSDPICLANEVGFTICAHLARKSPT